MAADTAADVTRRLIGNWKLVKYETFDQNGAVRPGRYIGYCGPFTVDAQTGTVTHHVIGSSYPHWIGTDQVRYYGFSSDGNQLTLSVKAGDEAHAVGRHDKLTVRGCRGTWGGANYSVQELTTLSERRRAFVRASVHRSSPAASREGARGRR